MILPPPNNPRPPSRHTLRLGALALVSCLLTSCITREQLRDEVVIKVMDPGGKPVAGYAHAARHCSYFPHSGSVIDQVEPELLEGYDWAKGTLRFPVNEVPDEALVRRLVEIRLAMLDEERPS